MQKKCLVCSSSSFEEIFNRTLLKCKSCGFITANMAIDVKELEKVYTENYFKGEEYVDYLNDKEILQTNFKKRLNKIERIVGLTNIRSSLEIGCAYGFFGEILSNKLKDKPYVGYDVVPEAIDYGKNQLKQNIFCEDYLSVKHEEKFSDIFMWDVIEHLPHPKEFIAKAASELEPGGRIYITTGDIERLLPKFQGAKWRMIHPPSHLHYFSKNTISKLLDSNGFDVISVSYPPVYRSIRLIYFSLFMLRKKPSKLIEKIYSWIPVKANFPLNTYDIMFVIAKKRK